MRIQVGLVEDNPRLAQSITTSLRMFDNIELTFIANNGEEAVTKVDEYPARVILMDINMPVMNGIEATRIITAKHPGVKVVMLTVFDENDKIFESILAGASGYILKDEKPGKIIQAIEEAIDGGAPMSPVIATKALQLLKGMSPERTAQGGEEFGLTSREFEILNELAGGLSYSQIADKLFVSPKTVRKHIENIYKKLQVHNKIDAVTKAMKHQIIEKKS